MWPDMFYSHKGPMGVIYPQAYFNFPMRKSKIPTATPQFSITVIPTELMGILPDVTGSGNPRWRSINWYYQYIGL